MYGKVDSFGVLRILFIMYKTITFRVTKSCHLPFQSELFIRSCPGECEVHIPLRTKAESEVLVFKNVLCVLPPFLSLLSYLEDWKVNLGGGGHSPHFT